MKLCTYVRNSGSPRAGLVVGDDMADIQAAAAVIGEDAPDTVLGILEGGKDVLSVVRRVEQAAKDGTVPVMPIGEVLLLPAIPAPPTLFLLAANYQSHVTESGAPPVDKATITPRPFIKPGTAVIGSGDPIVIPPDSDTLDYEIEIAAVVGTGGRMIALEDASSHIAGYVVFNDVSARSLKIAEGRSERNGDWFFDWLLGKWCDSFAVVGPYLVTSDEIEDPSGLDMSLWVNGELRQHSDAGEMIFTVPETIAFLSRLVTLRPGDLICMGTPGGVGATTATYLKPGDVVKGMIEHLGTIENTVTAMDSPQ